MNDLLAEAREMGYRVAPELREQPLYLELHPDELPMLHKTCAYFSKMVPTFFRDRLVERGEWLGCGTFIAFSDRAIRADEPEAFRANFLQTALHEYGHALPLWPLPPDVEPDRQSRRLCELMFEVESQPPRAQASEPMPWWNDHGCRHIRTVLHLEYRARVLGYPVPGDLTADFLSSMVRYAMALGDEVERFVGKTFAEIQQDTPPRAFMELWRQDVRAWINPPPCPWNQRTAAAFAA